MDEPMIKLSNDFIDDLAMDISWAAWSWAIEHGADPDDEDRYIQGTDDVRMAIRSALKGVLV